MILVTVLAHERVGDNSSYTQFVCKEREDCVIMDDILIIKNVEQVQTLIPWELVSIVQIDFNPSKEAYDNGS